MQDGSGATPARVLIADEISNIVSTLEKLAPYSETVEPCGMARDIATLLEEARRLQPDVILLNPSICAGEESSTRRAVGDASARSRIVFVAGAAEDGGVLPPYRQSGDQVISADISGRDLLSVVLRLRPRQPTTVVATEPILPLIPQRRRRTPPGRGEIFLVFAGKGGVGKSMVASNLAVALRIDTGRGVALVDLDLQFGDMALMLGLEHHSESIEELAHHGELVDQTLLSQVMVPGPEGVQALLAPEAPELAELITPPALRAILRELRRSYEFTVIDGPAHLDEQTLEVIDVADHIIVVTSFALTAVKDTRIMVKLLRSLGVDRDRISIVLNQTRARSTLLPEDVEERLGCRVRTQLPFEHRIVDDAVDRGLPFVMNEREAEITRRLHRLGAFMSAPATDDQPLPAEGAGRTSVPLHPFRRRFGIGRREQPHEVGSGA